MKVYECMYAEYVLSEHASSRVRVSVQGVKSLGSQYFNFYEVSKTKEKYFYTFDNFCSEMSSKRAKQHKSTTMTPNLPE